MNVKPQPEKPGRSKKKTPNSQAQVVQNTGILSKQQIWLAISNLNLFALGYFFSGQKKRWYFFLGGGFLLLILAQISNASKHPLLWAMLFLLYFLGMAVDLWFLLKKVTPAPPKLLQKNFLYLPIAALLVNLVFFSGFFLFRAAGNNLYQAGLTAQKENDIQAVFGNWYALSNYYRLSLNPHVVEVEKPLGEVALLIDSQQLVKDGEFNSALETIDRFNVLYPDSTRKSLAAEISVDAYLGWAKDLAGQNDYMEALNKIYHAINYFPTQTKYRYDEVDAAFSALYLDWGIYLGEQKDFSAAIDKLEYLLSHYPEATETQTAYETAAQTYVDWAIQASEDEDYIQAASNLDTVLEEYGKSDVVTQVRKMLPVAYLNSAGQLDSESHYLLAIERLEAAKDMGLSAEQEQEADEEYQNTIQLLARDSGQDGRAVLAEAAEEACSGLIPTHPSVGILVNEPGKVVNCCRVKSVSFCSNWSMPSDLVATNPGSFQYTVLRISDSRKVQSCPFTGGHTLVRLQDMDEVTITSVATGEVVASKVFYGGSPDACPMVYFFSSSTASIMGDFVNNSSINEWIAEVLK